MLRSTYDIYTRQLHSKCVHSFFFFIKLNLTTRGNEGLLLCQLTLKEKGSREDEEDDVEQP